MLFDSYPNRLSNFLTRCVNSFSGNKKINFETKVKQLLSSVSKLHAYEIMASVSLNSRFNLFVP